MDNPWMAKATMVYVDTMTKLLARVWWQRSLDSQSDHPQTIPGWPWRFGSSVTVDMTMEYLSYSGNFIQLCHVAVSLDMVGVSLLLCTTLRTLVKPVTCYRDMEFMVLHAIVEVLNFKRDIH